MVSYFIFLYCQMNLMLGQPRQNLPLLSSHGNKNLRHASVYLMGVLTCLSLKMTDEATAMLSSPPPDFKQSIVYVILRIANLFLSAWKEKVTSQLLHIELSGASAEDQVFDKFLEEFCLNFEFSTALYEPKLQIELHRLVSATILNISGFNNQENIIPSLSDIRESHKNDSIYRDYELFLVIVCSLVIDYPEVVPLENYLKLLNESKFYSEYRRYFQVQKSMRDQNFLQAKNQLDCNLKDHPFHFESLLTSVQLFLVNPDFYTPEQALMNAQTALKICPNQKSHYLLAQLYKKQGDLNRYSSHMLMANDFLFRSCPLRPELFTYEWHTRTLANIAD